MPEDPRAAMEFTIPCPACDDGDFHEPRYFTASGREVVDPRPDAASQSRGTGQKDLVAHDRGDKVS